jgi:hypothetical protein
VSLIEKESYCRALPMHARNCGMHVNLTGLTLTSYYNVVGEFWMGWRWRILARLSLEGQPTQGWSCAKHPLTAEAAIYTIIIETDLAFIIVSVSD